MITQITQITLPVVIGLVLVAIFRPYSRVIVGAGFFILIGFTIVRNVIPALEWGSGA